MTSIEDWKVSGDELGYTMPRAPRWKRLPIIRHVRTIYAACMVELWYSNGPGVIGVRTGADDWVLWGMWRGLETPSTAGTAPPRTKEASHD